MRVKVTIFFKLVTIRGSSTTFCCSTYTVTGLHSCIEHILEEGRQLDYFFS